MGSRIGRTPVLTFALTICLMAVLVYEPADAEEGMGRGQGDIGVSFAGGSGTPSDPYQITNVHHLQSMMSYLSAHYVLTTDIDASGTSSWNGGLGFEPVGYPVIS